MGYETYNQIVIDYTELLETITISSSAPLSISIPVKTNVGTTLLNSYTTPQKFTFIGIADLEAKEVN